MTSQKGQTLLEILLAFSISIMVLSAVILGITTSLNNTQYTKNQGLANSYAQEGIAVARKTRDSSWFDFQSKSGHYCLAQGATELPSSVNSNCGQNVGVFSREVIINHGDSDCSEGIPPAPTPTPVVILKGSKVTVRVSWSDSKCPTGTPFCNNVELITCFSTIGPTPTP